ncbi:mono/diheme cytochrome c family protein [Evansella vedderi]|uniref:Mono/diheme cytochrome c family protein n=1 Tax=Evansella vedderi TaxID=38282 RepID=A0ABT9ZS43_9BACI|nr:cytochrome C [Evansella vedderi]MDQ0253298.1 mono/diheme cytochrome c family protein [Evansella vedderi]
MKSNLLIFFIGFMIALPVGFFIFQSDSQSTAVEEASENATENREEANNQNETTEEPREIPTEAIALQGNGCVACHAVETLNLDGPATGPDLSNAYTIVEAKHGKSIEEYLQNPTTAVMASVMDGHPLSDEALESVVEALRLAAQ